MKNFLLIFFSLFSLTYCFGQKKFEYKSYHFPAKYLLKNSTDTIFTRINNADKNKFPLFSYSTIWKYLVFRDDDGKKRVIKENDIQYLEITDNQNIKRKFVSSSSLLDRASGLVELFYCGRICFFSDYKVNTDLSYNSFGRDIIVVKDYIIDNQNNKTYGPFVHQLGAFSAMNLTKDIKNNFENFPDLLLMVDNIQSKDDFISLLEAYDRKFQ